MSKQTNSAQSDDAVTRFFHWTVLIVLLIEFPIAWHLFFGALLLLLIALRLLWRLTHAALPLEPMPRWQELAAKAAHGGLYLGLIGLHVLAALYHHWIQHDGTLRRMLPNRRR